MIRGISLFFWLVLASGLSVGEPRESIEKLHEMANMGRQDAAYRLGYLYWHGEGVKANKEMALHFLDMAERLGMPDARYARAILLLGEAGQSESERGRAELTSLAKAGYPGARLALANHYLFEYRVPGHKRIARNWYIMAANAGEAAAFYNAGILLLDEEAGKADTAEAIRFLKLAADKNSDTDAMRQIGDIYRKSSDFRQDPELALKWYRRAAELGDAAAQYNLGYAYFVGEGTRHDPGLAYLWARKAADQGMREADSLVGLLCKDWTEVCVYE